MKKEKGDFKASLIQVWSFVPKRRSRLLEKTEVDFGIYAPSVELRPKRRQCLFEKTKVDLRILAPSVELRPKRRHRLLRKTKMDLSILGSMRGASP